MRESEASCAACEKLLNERVMPGYGLALVMVKLIWSVPKKRAIISAQAAPRTAWSDGYSGWLGVSRYEFHAGSAAVCGLPSFAPLRMAVTGRQKLYRYLAPSCQRRLPGRRLWQDGAKRKGARYPIG